MGLEGPNKAPAKKKGVKETLGKLGRAAAVAGSLLIAPGASGDKGTNTQNDGFSFDTYAATESYDAKYKNFPESKMIEDRRNEKYTRIDHIKDDLVDHFKRTRDDMIEGIKHPLTPINREGVGPFGPYDKDIEAAAERFKAERAAQKSDEELTKKKDFEDFTKRVDDEMNRQAESGTVINIGIPQRIAETTPELKVDVPLPRKKPSQGTKSKGRPVDENPRAPLEW